jgi:hypothetical protein
MGGRCAGAHALQSDLFGDPFLANFLFAHKMLTSKRSSSKSAGQGCGTRGRWCPRHAPRPTLCPIHARRMTTKAPAVGTTHAQQAWPPPPRPRTRHESVAGPASADVPFLQSFNDIHSIYVPYLHYVRALVGGGGPQLFRFRAWLMTRCPGATGPTSALHLP